MASFRNFTRQKAAPNLLFRKQGRNITLKCLITKFININQ